MESPQDQLIQALENRPQSLSDELLEISKRYEAATALALLDEDYKMRGKLADIPRLLKIVHSLRMKNEEAAALLKNTHFQLGLIVKDLED